MKICTKCGQELPLDQFGKFKQSKDGLAYKCKKCVADYQKRYREQPLVKAAEAARRRDNKHRWESSKPWYKRQYQQLHNPEIRESRRKKYHAERMEIIAHYSNGQECCQGCGCSDVRVLTVDHIKNNGNEHRALDPSANKIYKWLLRNGLPTGFQILCWNCQFIKKQEHQRKATENA